MPEKHNREAMLILAAGIMLAGSAIWRIGDSFDRSDKTIIISSDSEADSTSGVSDLPTSESVGSAAVITAEEETVPLMLDINAADAEELAELNGIGRQLAAEIVAYREKYGRFRNIEELVNVSGIGPAKLDRIRGNIYVTDPVYDSEVTTEPAYEPDTAPAETAPAMTLEDAAPININTADRDLLALLPHVDEETADEIIELREKIGGFSNAYELLYAESLTKNEVADIIEYVTVE